METSFVECPRCLGKGHVDHEDIKRHKQELRWLPGTCAYCNGTGKVSKDLIDSVDVDKTYLTNDLSEEEKEKVLNNDLDATMRGIEKEIQSQQIIDHIKDLHFNHELNVDQISTFFTYENDENKEKLFDFIQRVIDSESNSNL
ncbi:hypothetical protein [Flammeovirga sp. SubArs3]|uniref:hypothetical protein n=1 Tax=Flammeovirga sp. SubArs3 TaxID=2995316 RepID=UPI00248BE569|nr:hypothetical protein [Flammeovirga sp. SubArs3]